MEVADGWSTVAKTGVANMTNILTQKFKLCVFNGMLLAKHRNTINNTFQQLFAF